MAWPTLAQFNTMMQNPAVAFRDAAYKTVTIEKDAVGLPRARSGAFAVVYRAVFPNQESMAVRVFSSDIPARRERYKAIYDHLSQQSLNCLVPFTYSDNGFRAADGKWYPLITMEWVKGDTLFDWLQKRASANDAKAISGVSDQWRETVQHLGKAQVAHGDLQHANVMITDTSKIKLVDYDGMCVPKLVGLKNEEIGVEPYQHPQRDGNTQLTLSLDNFSSAFIYVGLKALSAEPRLWHDFVVQPEYDKILFRKEDFTQPTQSALFNRLRRSPDGDVQRLATRLCELWRVRIDEVPKLDELLFSFEQVKVLLDKRDFDDALAMLTRNNKQSHDAPPDLQPRITDAQQRVAKRVELEAAVHAADESRMAAIVGSPLLQGYPKAAEALTMAVDAPAVAESIRKLEAARAARNWRNLVTEWDAALPVLKKPKGSLRKSVAGYEAEVVLWREKNGLCDQLLACLKVSEPDAASLADLWKKLTDRGGHPESDGHKQTIDGLIQRDQAWKAFQRVPGTATESADKALVAAWNESLFRGWPRAESERGRVDLSKKRLEAAAVFAAAAQAALSRGGEQQVIALAGALPRGYPDMVASRSAMARKRLESIAAIEAALAADSDSELASAFRHIEELQATSLVEPAAHSRIQTAVKRETVLATLREIPANYSPAQAPQWDKKILAAWNEQLLEGCRDAAAWRTAYGEAERRQKLLKKLAAAVAKGDTLLGSEIVEDGCLRGYAFDDGTKRWIESARADAGSVRGMVDGLTSGNRSQFAAHFNTRLVRSHAASLRNDWSKVLDWVKSDVLPTARLGLAPPRAQRPLELEKSRNQKASRCTIRWNWPEIRFSDECRVMICRNRPVAGESPDSIGAWLDFPMTREMYQSAGGFRRQTIDAAWQGSYVVVWAKIDLGTEVLWSEPLVLGKV